MVKVGSRQDRALVSQSEVFQCEAQERIWAFGLNFEFFSLSLEFRNCKATDRQLLGRL